MVCYGVLFKVSSDYPPVKARLHTCYAPVRRSPSTIIANRYAAPRLACVRPAASVYPEPGSNSPLLMLWFVLRLESNVVFGCFFCTPFPFCFFLLAESSCVLPSSGSGYLILSRNALVFRLFSQRLFRDPCHNHYGCASPGYLSRCGGKGKTFFYRFLIFFVIFLANLLLINNLGSPTLLRLQR